jgi:hypothetical protein
MMAGSPSDTIAIPSAKRSRSTCGVMPSPGLYRLMMAVSKRGLRHATCRGSAGHTDEQAEHTNRRFRHMFKSTSTLVDGCVAHCKFIAVDTVGTFPASPGGLLLQAAAVQTVTHQRKAKTIADVQPINKRKECSCFIGHYCSTDASIETGRCPEVSMLQHTSTTLITDVSCGSPQQASTADDAQPCQFKHKRASCFNVIPDTTSSPQQASTAVVAAVAPAAAATAACCSHQTPSPG